MRKQISSALLIAGTCIGGGTIALPMVLAKIGIIPSLLIMLMIWLLNYYPSLAGAELNLRSERGLSLGELGKILSGRGAQAIGEISVKLLSYAALTIHLCGSSSIIQKLLEEYLHCNMSILTIETCMALFGIALLMFPFKIISACNNAMFTGLIVLFLMMLCSMTRLIDFSNIPWMTDLSLKDALSVTPVIFAAFGYQLILHTLRDYCGRDKNMLRNSLFFGSLIPTIVYALWSSASLSVVFKSNPDFFMQMMRGQIEVGEFVKVLANASSLSNFQLMVWWMSILAIFTSYLGVSLGLADSLNLSLKEKMKSGSMRKLSASLLTILPAYFVAALVPNAFIKILGFAGAMFVVIGILIPVYLLFKTGKQKLYFTELKKFSLLFCIAAGLCVMGAQIFINN